MTTYAEESFFRDNVFSPVGAYSSRCPDKATTIDRCEVFNPVLGAVPQFGDATAGGLWWGRVLVSRIAMQINWKGGVLMIRPHRDGLTILKFFVGLGW